jgi:hypothetical protein
MHKSNIKLAASSLAILIVLICASLSQAAVSVQADEAYPAGAEVFTADPQLASPANRALSTTRRLRQSFQTASTFDVKKIVLSLGASSSAGGLLINLFEVENVNAGTFAAGNLIRTITIPVGELPLSTVTTGITLTDSDIFSLPQRNSGTTGYAIELAQVDTANGSTGSFWHTNSGTNLYAAGRYFIENGTVPSNVRDFGVALSSIGQVLLPGDTDGSGVVELADFTPIRTNYLQTVTERIQGDLNGDKIVSFADFRQWKTAYLASGAGSLDGIDLSFVSVPEPSTALLASITVIGMFSTRRRREDFASLN